MKKSFHKVVASSRTKAKSNSKLKDLQTKNTFTVLDSPTKSFSDKKEYKVIQLKNGLTACLIEDIVDNGEMLDPSESESDSDLENTSEGESTEHTTDDSDRDDAKVFKCSTKGTKLSAAALCIGVGSFSDPKEVPGLAHFLEHMVFMGSTKFPQENDFDSFINKHGGFDNASTDYEVTTFYFECFEKHLFTALDKFSQFFISPLMKRDSMTREREAVESEFQIAVPSDDFRKEQLLLSLSEETSPVNSFSWGNLLTLKEKVTDDKLYELLHEFRKRHYSAHRMTLAVQGRLPLATLQSYVTKCFSDIPNNNLPPDDFKQFSYEIFNTPRFNRLYYVKPVKDVCQVDLTFPMPSLVHMYKTKPQVYISWLLRHQGVNSLFSYLKKKIWVLSLYAGNEESGAEFNSIYSTFTISMVLTKDGFNNLKNIIESVFSFINLLKEMGPNERIFREIQCIEEISFRFEEDETAADNVEDLVENMQRYPPADYLTGEALMFDYKPDIICMLLHKMNPNNMNVMISSSEIPTGIAYDKLEPWFKTQYTDREIPADWLDSWKNAKPLPEFKLPEPNPYITTDFTILPKSKSTLDIPKKIMDTSLIELWYRKDDKFELPMGYFYYYIITPYALMSAKSSCLIQMYSILVNMNLAEEGYDAQMAELEYSIGPSEKGICVKISGYNQKLHLLIELVGKYLNNVADLLTKPIFEAVREKHIKSLYNGFLKPSRLCKDLRLSILQQNYFPLTEKHSMAYSITYDDMKTFSEFFLKNVYVQGLIQGNITSENAEEATNCLLKNLHTTELPVENRPRIIVNQLPIGERCCRVYSFDRENSNSIITNYYQCGKTTVKDTVILELILLLIEEPLFDKLRTKEQLGYKVSCSLRDTYGVLGYTVTVNTQADKYTTHYVDKRIEEFLECSQKLLKKLSEKKFIHAKRDLLKIKHHIDIDLEDETIRNWEEILSCEYHFDRTAQEIKAIEQLQIDEVRNWWEQCNTFNKNNTCRKLTIQIVGHKLEQEKTIEKQLYVPVESNSVGTSAVTNQPSVPNYNIKSDYGSAIKNFDIIYLQNSQETIEKGFDSYFIKDVNEFKKTLIQIKDVPT